MTKVAIYARVSTEEQFLGTQVEAMSGYCQRQGWEFEVFQEKISGTEDSRPILNALLQRLRLKEFEILMVYKLDRLGRSLQHLLNVLHELELNGVSFVSMGEGFDTRTPQGKFFFQIAGAFAEFERNLISERTKVRMAYLKKHGKHCGRPAGSKDKGDRRKSGYYLRWAGKKGGASN
jgi:DNA invertase Pin-like site-specific DNA recombinase